MIELLLGALIVSDLAVIALYAYSERLNRFERGKLINALIAKSETSFLNLEMTDKVRPIEPNQPTTNDFIPESDMSDDEFYKMIDGKQGGTNG